MVASLQDASSERVAESVLERGYAILPEVIPAELVAELARAIDRVLEEGQIPRGPNVFLGRETRRIFNLLSRDPVFAQVPVHPATLPVVERVLDDELLLSSLTGVEMGPGETEQPFHADDGSVALPRPHVPLSCTAIWALSDFTARNGGTRVVPGSHRFDRKPSKGEKPEFIHVEMPAGSVVVYHGSLWHAGGANQTSDRRLGIICNYCAGFMRQEECQLLALPPDLVATFPPRLRALIGYSTYRGLLGHVDQQNPAVLIDPETATDMVWRKMR